MTVVPLPDVSTVRIRVIGQDDAANDWGTRFYLSYTGSAPSGANCTTLATDVAAAYSTDLAALAHSTVLLKEVDVLDIATRSGLSGQWTGSTPGTNSGTVLPIQTALNVEYGIARRYRGGKPRGFWPFGSYADLADQSHWTSAFLTAADSAFPAFFSALEALDIGSMGTLAHINLAYYHLFTNVANSSGREHAVPTYKATATSDVITGYFPKSLMGSQRRRRSATTP